MKKKKIYFPQKVTQKGNPELQKEKTGKINNALIDLRRSFLHQTKNNKRLENKLNHFGKLFKSKIKDDDKVNFISFHLFTDNLESK